MSAPNLRKISSAQSAEIAELRERGWSYGRIATKFSVSDGAVHYHCLKQGAVSPRSSGKIGYSGQSPVHAKDGRTQRRFTPQEDDQLLRLSLEGRNIREICEFTGRAPTSVRIRLMTLALHEEMGA